MSQSPILLNLDVRFHDLYHPKCIDQLQNLVTDHMYVRNHWIHDTQSKNEK